MVKTFLSTLVLSTLLSPPATAITTFGNPNDPLYSAPGGSFYDGVAALFLQFGTSTFGCSGSLLGTGQHVLTAAHCVTDYFGAALPDSTAVFFVTEDGVVSIPAVEYLVFPLWNGDLFSGTDLAIIQLATLAPDSAQRYTIYTGNDEVGAVANVAGFGTAGSGGTGAAINFGTRRQGYNVYDADGTWLGLSENILFGDFDNGLAENDAMGLTGLQQLGLGAFEAVGSFGDSGGPSFINGQVAGVHSFLASFGTCPPDVDTPANLVGPAGCKLDGSFGELFGDTRVSKFQDFVASVPEPGTYGLMLAGLGAMLALRRRVR